MREFKDSRSTFDVTSLSDEELVRGIVADEKDSCLADELWRRINPVLAKTAKAASFKKEYCLTEDAALNEAYFAARDALRLYDASKGISLKTYLGIKIKYHFLELARKNAIHARRIVPYVEDYEENDDGTTCYAAGHDELYREISEKCRSEERQKAMKQLLEQLQSLVTEPRHRDCLKYLWQAYIKGEPKPVQYAAAWLKCTRQQVYNILNRVMSQLPGDFADEVRGLF